MITNFIGKTLNSFHALGFLKSEHIKLVLIEHFCEIFTQELEDARVYTQGSNDSAIGVEPRGNSYILSNDTPFA
jgi:hypothetical protein